jgi:alpha-L-rhamnosidase
MSHRPYLLLLALAAAVLAAAVGAQPSSGKPTTGRGLSSRVWSGKWIWTGGDPSPRNSYAYFRKSFQLDASQREAQVHITADSRYQLFVNGTFVGRGPVRSDRRWLYYDTWNVAPHLKKGKNTVAVLVHHYGEWTFQYMHGRGGLIADVVGFAGRPLVHTDSAWRARRSEAWSTGQPRMSIQLGFNEIYDAAKEPVGWKDTDFEDGGWPAAVEIGAAGIEPWPNLVARDIPAMLEEPFSAQKVLETVEVEVPAGAQHIDLLPLMEPKTWGAAYLTTTLVSPDRREVELKFGSDDALKVWLNGKLVLSRLLDRAAQPDQDSARVTLEPGNNRLLAKVVQGHSKWEFYFRMSGNVEGVMQAGVPGAPSGGEWSVAGPFTFPMDPSLKAGFDAVYPPEQGVDLAAKYRNATGPAFGWRSVRAGAKQFAHVSQIMAAGQRRPLQAVEVRSPERLIQSGPEGVRVKTASGADVSFLVDFGKEVTGYPRFRIRGAKGGEIIDMGYGEVLQDQNGAFIPQSMEPPVTTGTGASEDGATKARLNPDRDGVHYADRYLCRPGSQEFQTFDKRGFRYLQVDVRNAPEGIEIDGVGLLFSTFPVKYEGTFKCSDERLNKIWDIGRYTCQLNMEDGYTDCPWRERGQWWGDARVEALINYYCFGDETLIRKALRQKGQSLNEEGITWGVYPTDWDGGRLPSFTLIWVSTLWDYYLYTGDRDLLQEVFPKVRSTLDKFFAPKVSERGLLKDVPYWVFIDWAPVDTAGESGALNAYYYDALRVAASIGRLLGDAGAGEYDRRADAVKRAMNAHLWDPQAGVYRDSILPDGKLSAKISQQTNSLCVLFDIAPREAQGAILTFIYAPENKGRVVEAGSPYFSYYQLAALYHAGRDAEALAYIRKQWGRMLDWGATTWWEMWNPGASFCHGWSGGPTFNLSAEILGIKPLKPGFTEVSVAPQWLDLQYATGVVPTKKGDVSVAWQRDATGKAVALRVEAPDGVPVEITLPGEGEIRVNRKPVLPAGVTKMASPRGTMRFRVDKGGSVLFEVKEK